MPHTSAACFRRGCCFELRFDASPYLPRIPGELFTAYAAMSAIKERLEEMNLPWTIFTLGRNAVHTTQQFKASPGSALLATEAAGEGFDFPGDCVSLLVIFRLPFSQPDALKEKKQAEYPDLHSFIRDVVMPEMQIKLKQGFGRAIRTETDTCVVEFIYRAKGPDYFQESPGQTEETIK